MKDFIEKYRKFIFFAILACTFACVFVYNVLTPYLSDDYAYLSEIRSNAVSFTDVIRLAYAELFEHGGRFLHYVTFRIFFYIGNKQIFNVYCSLIFVVFGLAIYANIEKKKKYDIFVIMLIFLLVWLFEISFGQTVLWITGAAVYLFATTYILLSLALYKHLLNTAGQKHPGLVCVPMFIIALFAGNSSENNSGAAILLIIIYTLNAYIDFREKNSKKLSFGSFVKPYMIAAWAGYILGYLLLTLAPGAHSRANSVSEGDYQGTVGILSHIYKLSMSLRDNLWIFLVSVTVLTVALAVTGHFKSFKDVRKNNALLFVFATIASTYALMFIPLPVKRVFFGACSFLIIASIQLLLELKQNETAVKIVKYSAVSLLCLMFFFTYLENLVNLARITREENERIGIIKEAASQGATYVEVPMYREAFRNEYSAAHDSDMTEDPGYWINTFYEDWFGVEDIVAVPRDEWNE
ncbi:MAG: DUF6056 family protein, partial [Lachnospiraceae bacterium]|nr:DUF6056 family protein [Lachnospiraceae bacterium]